MVATDHAVITPTIITIPRERLRPGPWQPRRLFDPDRLQELADSIRMDGILTPLRVTPDDRAPAGERCYLIVAGERRWRAAELAGLTHLPCLVEPSPSVAQVQAIVDNLHREDLRPGEEARGLQLLEALGLSQREIAARLGKSQAWVSQRLSLRKLPDEAIEALDQGRITVEDARELAKIAKWPEIVPAVLDRENGQRAIARWLGDDVRYYVPTDPAGRVKHLLDRHARNEETRLKIERLRAEGKTVYERRPPEGLVPLNDWADVGKAHKAYGLTCEALVVTDYSTDRYCTDPAALKAAVARMHKTGELLTPGERRLREQQRQQQAQEKARGEAFDAVMRAVLLDLGAHMPAGGALALLAVLAEARALWYCDSNGAYARDALRPAARWLGLKGSVDELKVAIGRLCREGPAASAIRAWLALEVADALDTRIRLQTLRDSPRAAAWLAAYGYRDPYPAAPASDAQVDVAMAETLSVDDEDARPLSPGQDLEGASR